MSEFEVSFPPHKSKMKLKVWRKWRKIPFQFKSKILCFYGVFTMGVRIQFLGLMLPGVVGPTGAATRDVIKLSQSKRNHIPWYFIWKVLCWFPISCIFRTNKLLRTLRCVGGGLPWQNFSLYEEEFRLLIECKSR